MIFFRITLYFIFLFYTYQSYSEFKYEIEIIEISDGTYVILGNNDALTSKNGGAISNTGFIVGKESVFIIDAGPSYIYASEVINKIRHISKLPIKYLLITHHHPDHSFGISKYKELGVEVIMSQSEITRYEKYGNRLLRQMKSLIGEEWFENTSIIQLDNTIYNFPFKIDLGGRIVEILYYKNGHSEGDLIVRDIYNKLVFVGDLVFNNRAPTIPHANITNWSNYIDQIYNDEWSLLVPGHGPLIYDKKKIFKTKRWINYINAIAKNAANKGLSPAEVFEEGIKAEFKEYKLYRETWLRDLPLLMKKYDE